MAALSGDSKLTHTCLFGVSLDKAVIAAAVVELDPRTHSRVQVSAVAGTLAVAWV